MDITPGRAVFHVTIDRAHATFGELNIRVMALPEGRDASVAASLTIDLEGLGAKDLHRGLRFMAVGGVKYALYGFVNDTTDLKAAALDIALEELGHVNTHATAAVRDEAAPPVLARGDPKRTVSARRLLAEQELPPDIPYSQPMQSDGDDMELLDKRWPLVGIGGSDIRDRWGSCMALQMLDFVGLVTQDSRGLLVDMANEGLIETLKQAGCSINLIDLDADDIDLLALDHAEIDHDFAVVMAAAKWQVAGGMEMLSERVMECLAKAGFIVMIVEIVGGGSAAAFRNRMQQLTLNCIGMGHDVMQLFFPHGDSWYPQANTVSRFLWIARK
ncbi:MAG: hypothetical protein B7Y47_13935 [Sphingomonas sp. 28-63-12]|nr:MAG: hypothetical protein B7Y47_13935 [Sphingomonas sp. 28-63-12]